MSCPGDLSHKAPWWWWPVPGMREGTMPDDDDVAPEDWATSNSQWIHLCNHEITGSSSGAHLLPLIFSCWWNTQCFTIISLSRPVRIQVSFLYFHVSPSCYFVLFLFHLLSEVTVKLKFYQLNNQKHAGVTKGKDGPIILFLSWLPWFLVSTVHVPATFISLSLAEKRWCQDCSAAPAQSAKSRFVWVTIYALSRFLLNKDGDKFGARRRR